ncbi:MAG: zinc-ribbon domain-containing protein [Candidatus Hodarchaeota archaeon]
MSIKKMNPIKNYGCVTIKSSKFMLFISLTTICLLPLINYALAYYKPYYCGINEGQTYIWTTKFDKDPFQDYIEDLGYSEAYAENFTDWWFDQSEWDEDVEGWKIYILEIRDEKVFDYDSDEINCVPYLYNFYETENWDEKDWDREDHNKRAIIPKFDEDYYSDHMAFSYGLFKCFVSANTDWDDLADGFEDELEDDNEEGGANEEKRIFFFTEEECGISTKWEPKFTKKCEEHESKSIYTRDGILLYYVWTYDGDTIAEIVLEGAFLYYNWWWIFLSIIAIASIVILVTLLILAKKPEIPKPAIAKPPVVPPLSVKFCPTCGKPVKADDNFCTSCGSSLKE